MSRQRTRAPERQLGEDGQLVGGVGTVYVHRWVGFGITQPLGFGHGRIVIGAHFFHLGGDEVARAVQNAAEGENLVGGQRLADSADNRDAARHRRLEANRAAQFAARSNNSGPCSANRALFAVQTSLPLSSSLSMMVRAGSSPPTSWATTLISGLSVIGR